MLGKRAVWLAVILAAVCTSPVVAWASTGKITVVFRYDDYSSRSDTSAEREMISQFVERKLPVTLAVIPREAAFARVKRDHQPEIPLQPEKVRVLRDGGEYVDVAQHGYTHQWLSKSAQSEFTGMPLSEQRERISKGKRELERLLGRKITTFVPPWNSYGPNTARALAGLGFTCISAGLDGFPYVTDPAIKYLPATCEPYELRDVVREARRLDRPGIVIVVLVHDRDFVETNRWASLTLDDFADILDWTARQDDIAVRSVSELAASDADLSAQRLIAAEDCRDQPYFIPGRLRVKDRKLYMTTASARAELSRSARATVLYYVGLAVFCFVGTLAVGGMLRRFGLKRIYVIAGIMSVVSFAAYLVIHRQVGRLYATGASAGLGAYLAGLIFVLHRDNHRRK